MSTNLTTMKTLYFLRHAKTEAKVPGQEDFDRSLNGQGKNDAMLMSKILAKRMVHPIDQLITSPSKRTLGTLGYFAQELGIDNTSIIQEPKLYNATKEEMLESLWGLDDQLSTIMLIGHNPGISDIVDHLSNSAVDPLPTAGIACMEFEVEAWNEIGSKAGKLLYQDHPKLH